MNLFEEIRDKISTFELAQYYGLHPNQNGKNAKFLCCFHPDSNPSMVIYPNAFHCFACGAHVDVTGLVAKLFNLSNYEAAKKIIADFNLNIDYSKKTVKNNFNIKVVQNCEENFTYGEIEYGLKQWSIKALAKYAKIYNSVCAKLEKGISEKWKHLDDIKPVDEEIFWTLVSLKSELDTLTDILIYGNTHEIYALYQNLKNQEENNNDKKY